MTPPVEPTVRMTPERMPGGEDDERRVVVQLGMCQSLVPRGFGVLEDDGEVDIACAYGGQRLGRFGLQHPHLRCAFSQHCQGAWDELGHCRRERGERDGAAARRELGQLRLGMPELGSDAVGARE